MQNAEEKTVDIDTSGPGAEVELPEEQTSESNIEVSNDTADKDSVESNDSTEKSDEQSTVQADTTTDQGTEKKAEETEDEKKKELEDYSEGVKRRIAKLTRKMREAERREQAALDYAKKVQAEQESLKSRFTKLDTGYVSEMENRIKSSMEAAAAKLARAREDGDLKAEIAAQTEISKLGYEEAKLSEIKSRQTEPKAEEKVVQQPQIQAQTQEQPINPDPKAQQWAQKNTWFGQDEAMTYTAFSLHKKLVEEEGYDPQSDEYYSEIDKRIKLEFPHKFGSVDRNTTSKPTQVVASANRSSKPGRKSVRLTPSQVAIANKLGVPLEEYAKQLNLITKE
jgi:hypothetical protein